MRTAYSKNKSVFNQPLTKVRAVLSEIAKGFLLEKK